MLLWLAQVVLQCHASLSMFQIFESAPAQTQDYLEIPVII